MKVRTDELKMDLDEIANQIADEVQEIARWEAWIVYLLEDFELQAASLDPEHPKGYRVMLERLREEIDGRLRRGAW
ncbi:MAG TPA: hypothetical protein VIK64_05595 [Anaerolineales bacterium]|jgi:hypothetical protein